MSTLLQDVLRSSTASNTTSAGADSNLIERKLNSLTFNTNNDYQNPNTNGNGSDAYDSDDELINVISVPGTPSRTRPPSPSRGSPRIRPARVPLSFSSLSSTLSSSSAATSSPKPKTTDPLKLLPTELSQKIFGKLSIRDLARCALVSKKWGRSQTINYVWFQHYRKENFKDDSLPPGKWTKRESKQNWRITHLKSAAASSPTNGSFFPSGYSTPSQSYRSGYHTPSGGGSYGDSGYATPRELKEAQWKQEQEASASPGKLEMRAMYKEMGGRKARGKGVGLKASAGRGGRDKGGWGEGQDEGWD